MYLLYIYIYLQVSSFTLPDKLLYIYDTLMLPKIQIQAYYYYQNFHVEFSSSFDDDFWGEIPNIRERQSKNSQKSIETVPGYKN